MNFGKVSGKGLAIFQGSSSSAEPVAGVVFAKGSRWLPKDRLQPISEEFVSLEPPFLDDPSSIEFDSLVGNPPSGVVQDISGEVQDIAGDLAEVESGEQPSVEHAESAIAGRTMQDNLDIVGALHELDASSVPAVPDSIVVSADTVEISFEPVIEIVSEDRAVDVLNQHASLIAAVTPFDLLPILLEPNPADMSPLEAEKDNVEDSVASGAASAAVRDGASVSSDDVPDIVSNDIASEFTVIIVGLVAPEKHPSLELAPIVASPGWVEPAHSSLSSFQSSLSVSTPQAQHSKPNPSPPIPNPSQLFQPNPTLTNQTISNPTLFNQTTPPTHTQSKSKLTPALNPTPSQNQTKPNPPLISNLSQFMSIPTQPLPNLGLEPVTSPSPPLTPITSPNPPCFTPSQEADLVFPPCFTPTHKDMLSIRELINEGVSLVPIEFQNDFVESVDKAEDGESLEFFNEKFQKPKPPTDDTNYVTYHSLRRSSRIRRKPAKIAELASPSGLKKGFIK